MDHEHPEFLIEVANEKHVHFASIISQTMEESARARGTGISKRSADTLIKYIREGNSLIAIHESGQWAGFCYLSAWDNGSFVSNSGLIVAPEFRDHGVAKKLKTKLFELSRKKYPDASIVGITTSAAVMKMNTALGFHATAFADLPKEEKFWEGCKSCVNHDILTRTTKRFCLCTAMRYDPNLTSLERPTVPSLIASEEFH